MTKILLSIAADGQLHSVSIAMFVCCKRLEKAGDKELLPCSVTYCRTEETIFIHCTERRKKSPGPSGRTFIYLPMAQALLKHFAYRQLQVLSMGPHKSCQEAQKQRHSLHRKCPGFSRNTNLTFRDFQRCSLLETDAQKRHSLILFSHSSSLKTEILRQIRTTTLQASQIHFNGLCSTASK